MKQENIPLLSYVFIGVTSLVLTYATIADTKGEVINVPVQEPAYNTNTAPEPTAPATMKEPTAPAASSPSFTETIEQTIDKLKSMVPSSSAVATTAEVNTSNVSQNTIPVAVPVPDTKSSSYGGKKSIKRQKKKQKKTRRTRK